MVLDEATKIINNQLDKRKHYVKIPDIKSLPLDEAAKVLEQYEFNYALISNLISFVGLEQNNCSNLFCILSFAN